MIDCPKCGSAVDGVGPCQRCGFGKKHEATADPYHWLCANVETGQRCAKPGALSHGTHGGGPWYCRDHFSPRSGGPATAPPLNWRSSIKTVGEAVSKGRAEHE